MRNNPFSKGPYMADQVLFDEKALTIQPDIVKKLFEGISPAALRFLIFGGQQKH